MREKKIAPVKFPKRQEALTERSDSGLFIWKSKTDKTTLDDAVHVGAEMNAFPQALYTGKNTQPEYNFLICKRHKPKGQIRRGITTGVGRADLQSAIFMYPDKKNETTRERKNNLESLPKMEHRTNICNSV